MYSYANEMTLKSEDWGLMQINHLLNTYQSLKLAIPTPAVQANAFRWLELLEPRAQLHTYCKFYYSITHMAWQYAEVILPQFILGRVFNIIKEHQMSGWTATTRKLWFSSNSKPTLFCAFTLKMNPSSRQFRTTDPIYYKPTQHHKTCLRTP